MEVGAPCGASAGLALLLLSCVPAGQADLAHRPRGRAVVNLRAAWRYPPALGALPEPALRDLREAFTSQGYEVSTPLHLSGARDAAIPMSRYPLEVFFYTGHGVMLPREGRCAHELALVAEDGATIPVKRLMDPPRHDPAIDPIRVYLVDACYSACARLPDHGRHYLLGTSVEQDRTENVLLRVIVAAIRDGEADHNCDGFITVHELYRALASQYRRPDVRAKVFRGYPVLRQSTAGDPVLFRLSDRVRQRRSGACHERLKLGGWLRACLTKPRPAASLDAPACPTFASAIRTRLREALGAGNPTAIPGQATLWLISGAGLGNVLDDALRGLAPWTRQQLVVLADLPRPYALYLAELLSRFAWVNRIELRRGLGDLVVLDVSDIDGHPHFDGCCAIPGRPGLSAAALPRCLHTLLAGPACARPSYWFTDHLERCVPSDRGKALVIQWPDGLPRRARVHYRSNGRDMPPCQVDLDRQAIPVPCRDQTRFTCFHLPLSAGACAGLTETSPIEIGVPGGPPRGTRGAP